MQSKSTSGYGEFALITVFALTLYLPYRSIQYDTNGIDEAQFLEAGQLFHRNHMLYRPLGNLVYRASQLVGYSGNSLGILQIINALCGAIGVGLWFVTFKYVVKDRTAALVGSLWLATSFSYWYFSTDAGYIMLAALFALAALAAAVYGRAIGAGIFTVLSVLTWQASIFLLPLPLGEVAAKRRVRVAIFAVVCIGAVYAIAGISHGHRTPIDLLKWVTSYGEFGTLPLWGAWGWDRPQSASISAVRSVIPILLAAGPGDFGRHVQLGRIAVDISIIALVVLFVLGASRPQRAALQCLAGYALFLPFIIWWDPFEPKWFLIPNIFLAGFLTSGVAPWLQHKYARLIVLACVLIIAATNFVTTIRPRHAQLGPDRVMARCVAEQMSEADLFVSAEWGWSAYLPYVHGRSSINLLNESLPVVKGRIAETQKRGGKVFMLDPASYSENYMAWLRNQTGLTREDLAQFKRSPAFTCSEKIFCLLE